jgi:hypothetical protein
MGTRPAEHIAARGPYQHEARRNATDDPIVTRQPRAKGKALIVRTPRLARLARPAQ